MGIYKKRQQFCSNERKICMKISADFYTPDEAARAAGAVKENVPMALDVAITGKAADRYENSSEKRGSYNTKVICRREDAAAVSHILVNRGGHNITSIQ